MVNSSVNYDKAIYSGVAHQIEHTFAHRSRVCHSSPYENAIYQITELQVLNSTFSLLVASIFSEIKCIIDAFGSHLDIDLQQRSVEFSQLFKAHNSLRPALLEKMPPMQITRVSNQNSDYSEENDGGSELILNGSEEDPEKVNNKIATSDSVCSKRVYSFLFCAALTTLKMFIDRMPYWIYLAAIAVQ